MTLPPSSASAQKLPAHAHAGFDRPAPAKPAGRLSGGAHLTVRFQWTLKTASQYMYLWKHRTQVPHRPTLAVNVRQPEFKAKAFEIAALLTR